jgi:hypothetical protein
MRVHTVRDPSAGKWSERWHRRGELLTIAGLTSTVTLAASGNWLGAGAACVVVAVGLYVVVAAEAGWRLPGRARERERARSVSDLQFREVMFDSVDDQRLASGVSRCASALDRIAAALEADDSKRPPRHG